MSKIITDRLILRHVLLEDMEDIYQYCKNPKIGLNAGWKPHKNRNETLDIMNNQFLNDKNIYSIIFNGKVIGTIGTMDDPKRLNKHSKMIGYSLAENYWNRGIMSEAVAAILNKCFKNKKINLISAYCYPDNIPSKKVIIKNGFKYEGTLRAAEYTYKKNLKDNECWSITYEEFQNFIKTT